MDPNTFSLGQYRIDGTPITNWYKYKYLGANKIGWTLKNNLDRGRILKKGMYDSLAYGYK